MYQGIGTAIAEARKKQRLTQKELADQLHISFQIVSKWEQNLSTPNADMLVHLAQIFQTSVDALLGYDAFSVSAYDEKYQTSEYYWGIIPNRMCYEIMQRRPPVKPYRVLDIGCGEGKDAVFLARNGYQVTAFDVSETGLQKARLLAQRNNVDVCFFKADIQNIALHTTYDIIFSSGVFHYIPLKKRADFVTMLQAHTSPSGLHAINVFVQKPFIPPAPDLEEAERRVDPWYSGDLMRLYAQWYLHQCEERIFDCHSGGIVHKHCMNTVIAQKPD